MDDLPLTGPVEISRAIWPRHSTLLTVELKKKGSLEEDWKFLRQLYCFLCSPLNYFYGFMRFLGFGSESWILDTEIKRLGNIYFQKVKKVLW